MPISSIWSREFGCSYIQNVFSRNRFTEILHFLRFDDVSSRSQRVSTDLFAPVRYIYDIFNCNSLYAYSPDSSMTIDEQLLPCKNRCRFIQFMPNKPDKFGIKFWLCVDVKTRYCLHGFPYLGRQDERRPNERLGDFVVKKLMEPFLNKGYNVTTDHFFTSISVAKYLLERKTTIVGTVRKSSAFRCRPMLDKKALFQSTFYVEEESGARHLTSNIIHIELLFVM
jgi:hypothetical protein